MVQVFRTNSEDDLDEDLGYNEDRRSSLLGFYRIERTQYCRGYAYVSFACFFFTFFLFFIKIADCSEEDCMANQVDPWNWTLQSLIAVGTVSLACLILGFIFMWVARHREKVLGYEPI